jgi:hypothetical protein
MDAKTQQQYAETFHGLLRCGRARTPSDPGSTALSVQTPRPTSPANDPRAPAQPSGDFGDGNNNGRFIAGGQVGCNVRAAVDDTPSSTSQARGTRGPGYGPPSTRPSRRAHRQDPGRGPLTQSVVHPLSQHRPVDRCGSRYRPNGKQSPAWRTPCGARCPGLLKLAQSFDVGYAPDSGAKADIAGGFSWRKIEYFTSDFSGGLCNRC